MLKGWRKFGFKELQRHGNLNTLECSGQFDNSVCSHTTTFFYCAKTHVTQCAMYTKLNPVPDASFIVCIDIEFSKYLAYSVYFMYYLANVVNLLLTMSVHFVKQLYLISIGNRTMFLRLWIWLVLQSRLFKCRTNYFLKLFSSHKNLTPYSYGSKTFQFWNISKMYWISKAKNR